MSLVVGSSKACPQNEPNDECVVRFFPSTLLARLDVLWLLEHLVDGRYWRHLQADVNLDGGFARPDVDPCVCLHVEKDVNIRIRCAREAIAIELGCTCEDQFLKAAILGIARWWIV